MFFGHILKTFCHSIRMESQGGSSWSCKSNTRILCSHQPHTLSLKVSKRRPFLFLRAEDFRVRQQTLEDLQMVVCLLVNLFEFDFGLQLLSDYHNYVKLAFVDSSAAVMLDTPKAPLEKQQVALPELANACHIPRPDDACLRMIADTALVIFQAQFDFLSC